jgi:hypothetical protein
MLCGRSLASGARQAAAKLLAVMERENEIRPARPREGLPAGGLLSVRHKPGHLREKLLRNDHQPALKRFGLADDRGKPRVVPGSFYSGDVRLLDSQRLRHGLLGKPLSSPHDRKLRRKRKLGELPFS